MPRLPIYILIEASNAMLGRPLQAVQNGLDAFRNALCDDPHASRSVAVCLISYGREPKLLLPLTDLTTLPQDLPLLEIRAQTGPSNLGEGLELTLERLQIDLASPSAKSDDWLPILFIMTDRPPTDAGLCRQTLRRTQTPDSPYRFARVVACAAGQRPLDSPEFKELVDETVELARMNGASFQSLCAYVPRTVPAPPPVATRRLPVCLLVDVRARTNGQPLLEIQKCLASLHRRLIADPLTRNSVDVSVVACASEPQIVLPSTDLNNFNPTTAPLAASRSAACNFGEGLELILECLDAEKSPDVGLPVLLALAVGAPTDKAIYRRTAQKIRTSARFARVVACAAGANAAETAEPLRELADDVVEIPEFHRLEEFSERAFLAIRAAVR